MFTLRELEDFKDKKIISLAKFQIKKTTKGAITVFVGEGSAAREEPELWKEIIQKLEESGFEYDSNLGWHRDRKDGEWI